MSELLSNYLSGRWTNGQSTGTALVDPVLGDELARVDASGLDLAAGFDFARERGGSALREQTEVLHDGERHALVDADPDIGGEELGGLRALNFYHCRAAVQASTTVLSALGLGQA
jgi:hypothetical protein